MGWTNDNLYMTVIFTAILIFVGIVIVGDDLIDSDRITLNEKSLDYIGDLKGMNEDNGYDTIKDTNSAESADVDILNSDENQTVSSSSDFLSTLYIKKERADQPTNFLKVVYNIPSSLVIGMGLPINDFKWVINILMWVLVLSIIILVWVRWIRT